MDQYAGWKKLLAFAQANKNKGDLRKAIVEAGLDKEINLDEPLSGFYRGRSGKVGPLLPIAIWRDEAGAVNVERGGNEVALSAVWPYCVWSPVTHADYIAVTEGGEKWPDEDATVAATMAENDNSAPGIGDNSKNDDRTPDQVIADQIEAAKAGAKDYAEITSDEQAARAQSLRSRALELSGEADKKREEEKRPHFELAKQADAKWQPLVKAGKAVADTIRSALSAWETKKYKAEQAELLKREAAQRKIDEANAAAAALAAAAGQPVPEPVAPIAPVEPPKAAPTTIKGGYGRAANVKPVRVATVVDQAKTYEYFRENPDLVALIAKLAQTSVNNGYDVPGVEVTEQRKVA